MTLTQDAFLGGRVQALQPAKGFRSGIDAVLMAAAVPAKTGDSVLELGCGAGVASLCLAARVPGVQVTGLERQGDYADLARKNGVQVVDGDLSAMPNVLRAQTFDHVMANPPYFMGDRRSAAKDAGREAALCEDTPLSVWIDAASRRLKPKGSLTIIQNAERLPNLLAALDTRVGAVRVLPIAARSGRAANLVLVQARKGARTPFVMLAPLVLHEGDRHKKDAESYTQFVRGILRDAAELPIG